MRQTTSAGGVRAFQWEHVCQGNYAVGEDYDGQIGHRYFDMSRTRPS